MSHAALTKKEGQALALAGLLQATYLINQLAKSGNADLADITPLINSLFQFDAESTEAVYGSRINLQSGLGTLIDVLNARFSQEHKQVLRYALDILYLERKLHKNDAMLSILRSRLEHIAFKAEHFTNNVDSVSASIAGLYQDTLSTLNYRIQVTGSVQHLQNTKNADLIRALLLCGIRSAMLWRQLGGNRVSLFLGRRKLTESAKHLLS